MVPAVSFCNMRLSQKKERLHAIKDDVHKEKMYTLEEKMQELESLLIVGRGIYIFLTTKKIFREVVVEVKIEQAPELSLLLMIVAIMIIKLLGKAWLVHVDQVVVTFMSQNSVQKLQVTRNSPMIGEQLSRTAADRNAIKGQ